MSEPAAPTAARPVTRTNPWIADLVAGVSVALVLIPQCMAYADLAGMPPHTGLYAAALPPLLAAFFASSPYLQTGPVALTSLLSLAALSTLAVPASTEYVLLAALLAIVVGAVRVVIGLVKAGAISYLMSQPVLKGFTAAAALLILSSQLPKVFGVAGGDGTVLERALFAVAHPASWEVASLGLSALTLLLMLGGRKVHALFPGVLVAVLVGIGYSVSTDYGGPVVGEIPSAVIPPLSLDLPWSRLPSLIIPGTIIALVGFAEAASASQAFAEQSRRPWDPDKEFVSQGVANLAAGVAGGFPVGGSFSRSAVNRLAGARTRWSGAITGGTVLVFLPFSHVLHALPMAVLGAIVVGAVLKLVDPRPLVAIWKQSRLQAVVGIITFVMTPWLAPHIEWAVLSGIALALGVHVWREQQFEVQSCVGGDTLTLTPEGVIWFGSAPLFRQALAQELSNHPNANRVVIDLSHVGRVDLTGALALRDVREQGRESEHSICIINVPPHAKRIIARVCTPPDGHATSGPTLSERGTAEIDDGNPH